MIAVVLSGGELGGTVVELTADDEWPLGTERVFGALVYLRAYAEQAVFAREEVA